MKERYNFTVKFKINFICIDKIDRIIYQVMTSSFLLMYTTYCLTPPYPMPEMVLLEFKLLDRNQANPIANSDILDVLNVCLEHNYFQFNNDNDTMAYVYYILIL